jgi:hypothetical protein
MRTLLLAHRYLGMATGPLMVMWCLSGIVMMYVPYPRLAESQRVHSLPPISWQGCCAFGPNDPLNAEGLDDLRIEMLAGRPVLRRGSAPALDLISGAWIGRVSAAQAAEVADAFAADSGSGASGLPTRARPRLLGVVLDDTWTVSGVSATERPLYRFALGDAAKTEVYVSSVSGKAIQVTTARQRFWNWLGAIPHWLYLVDLRRHARWWSAIVVYTSLAATVLTVLGIVIGLRQLRRPGGRWSPHHGLNLWHHVAGLVFGLLTLTWVFSGLLSMNPWGLFEGGDSRVERLRLLGARPAPERVTAAVAAIASTPAASGAVSVVLATLAGRIYFVVETTSGDRLRLDESGRVAPLTSPEIAQAATDLGAGIRVASVELMTKEDAYFFGHVGAAKRLPVYRVMLGDEGSTRYYLDSVSAEIEAKIDRDAKGYRWLHQGLHRLDVLPVLRRRPTWDGLMISLLSGVLAVCVAGASLGWRRLARQPRRSEVR